MTTKVTFFDICFECVLSNTMPYMPPAPSGTSKRPVLTISASHLPVQETHFMPMLSSFSVTEAGSPFVVVVVVAAAEGRAALPLLDLLSFSVAVWKELLSDGEDESWEAVEEPLVEPGCLNMPKLMDFL